jgi:hypothetical protein
MNMGSLIKFLGVGGGDDLPPRRAKLDRIKGELLGVEAKIAVLVGMKSRLEDVLLKEADAEREIDDLLDQGAQTLLDRLRNGGETSLSTLGRRAEELDQRVAASRHQAEIIRRAIDKIVDELNRLSDVHADLSARKADAIKEVVAEAFAPSYATWAQAIENVRQSMIEIAALEKFLARNGNHDHVPDQRLIATLPTYGCVGGEVIANIVQIAAVEAQLSRFAESLAQDPRTPAPEIVVNDERDELTYDRLSPAEKRQADRLFMLKNVQRETPDSRSLAQQIREEKAFVGFTN